MISNEALIILAVLAWLVGAIMMWGHIMGLAHRGKLEIDPGIPLAIGLLCLVGWPFLFAYYKA